jgi:hypothetical protein
MWKSTKHKKHPVHSYRQYYSYSSSLSSSSNLHKVFHLSSVRKISIHRHYVTLRIDEVITLHTCQKSPGLRNLFRMNNVRVDMTPRTIEINSMYGSTRTVRYLLTSNIGLERVRLSRFSLCHMGWPSGLSVLFDLWVKFLFTWHYHWLSNDMSNDLIIKSFDTGFHLSVWLSKDLITNPQKRSTIKWINTPQKSLIVNLDTLGGSIKYTWINFTDVDIGLVPLCGPMHLRSCVSEKRSVLSLVYLLWNNRVRVKYKTYMWVSVWWKSKVKFCVCYYGTMKQNLNRRLVYECRWDERLKTKDEGSTHLVYYESIKRDLKIRPI